MPVGRPDPDGDGVVSASRHYGGKTLGEATIWDCPSCGKKNEGRIPEKGCGHCGAGDPTKSRAGTQETPRPAASTQRPRRPASQPDTPEEVRPATVGELHSITQAIDEQKRATEGQRVLRLIEYRIKPGQNADEVLRRSLVGKMDMAWGSITATIVDSVDATQEDRLRLARRQPGVWVANESAMEQALAQDRARRQPPTAATIQKVRSLMDRGLEHYEQQAYEQQAAHNALQETLMPFDKPQIPSVPVEPVEPVIPDTGPEYTPAQEAFALRVDGAAKDYGYGSRFSYTLALALQTIAQELEANSEPEKFLSGEEVLQLANAFMHQVPEDWQGDKEETDGGTGA